MNNDLEILIKAYVDLIYKWERTENKYAVNRAMKLMEKLIRGLADVNQ